MYAYLKCLMKINYHEMVLSNYLNQKISVIMEPFFELIGPIMDRLYMNLHPEWSREV